MKLKILTLALIGIIFCSLTKAQNVQIGIAPEIDFPTGNASNLSGIGFGASLKAEVGVATKYAITAASGYNVFIGRRYLGVRTQNLEAVPAKLGFKYYSSPEFYLEAQAGAAFYTNGDTKTSFIWSPGIGTYFKTGNNKNKIDFGLRYEAWSSPRAGNIANVKSTSFGFIGLKLGYSFGL